MINKLSIQRTSVALLLRLLFNFVFGVQYSITNNHHTSSTSTGIPFFLVHIIPIVKKENLDRGVDGSFNFTIHCSKYASTHSSIVQ